MDAELEVTNLSKSFNGTPIVDDVSFSVKAGEIFGLIGPNGAGKTTTIRMALQIIQPDAGEVSVFGGPMDALSPAANRLPAGGARSLSATRRHWRCWSIWVD